MKITIKKNNYGEYEVPSVVGITGCDQIYFASDKADAIDTAKSIHGDDVKVTLRSGSYIEEN